jgi:hypothetical protein
MPDQLDIDVFKTDKSKKNAGREGQHSVFLKLQRLTSPRRIKDYDANGGGFWLGSSCK